MQWEICCSWASPGLGLRRLRLSSALSCEVDNTQSDLEKFVRVLFGLLREIREQFGAFAVVALGLILVAGIILGFLALRWIRRGGLRGGTSQRFWLSGARSSAG